MYYIYYLYVYIYYLRADTGIVRPCEQSELDDGFPGEGDETLHNVSHNTRDWLRLAHLRQVHHTATTSAAHSHHVGCVWTAGNDALWVLVTVVPDAAVLTLAAGSLWAGLAGVGVLTALPVPHLSLV